MFKKFLTSKTGLIVMWLFSCLFTALIGAIFLTYDFNAIGIVLIVFSAVLACVLVPVSDNLYGKSLLDKLEEKLNK